METMLDFAALTALADRLEHTARIAGEAIMVIHDRGFDVEAKADKSPVTEADEAAEAIILEHLAEIGHGLPVVAEEHVAAHGYPEFEGTSFWLVDALDGTREFINKRPDFTVNIGLILNGLPALGVVYAPVRDTMYLGAVDAGSDQRSARKIEKGEAQPIGVRPCPPEGATIVGSRSHQIQDEMDAFLADHKVAESIAIGSSLKFCLLAEGKADLYPRFGPTSEWDTAAGDAVLRAAGGVVRTFEGGNLPYKKEKFLNGKFIALGQP